VNNLTPYLHYSFIHLNDIMPVQFMVKACVNTFKFKSLRLQRSCGSSDSIVSDYRLDDRVIRVRSLAEAKDFFSSLCVQTGYEAHPASYAVDTSGPSSRIKRSWRMILTTYPHLVPKSRMSRSCIYTSFPPCHLHGSSGTALLAL
jgi:hypothetical protein